ncbi:uncharacterized protein EAF01_007401 [Botrytis porri]|uniref:Uncharacterized protein n=1 Tax=Botrytis porri TaxID=87229 RepID=A0A4Z1KGQ0_9HELO|nr:uncharacterized protein EAF01_007401 [Botrytis porri]KAF7902103.1 hypothetical protein EAF01_007401 [Botrytis porri]TGO82704.1 hypothetical protein BPOR_0774g00060 [Botrytis porri]
MVDENLEMQEVEHDLVIVGAARQYPGFRSESGLRMRGFSDIPIVLPPDAETYHDTFEAEYVTKYLEGYVHVHVYNEKSLRDRVIFGFKVGGIEKIDGIWSVWSEVVKNGNGNEYKRIIKTKKLAIATGQNSLPYIPTFPNQTNFQSPIVHQKHFRQISTSALASDFPYTAVTILGGGKSAADMVYECVKAGKKVSWLIRQSGEGPAIFAGAKGRGQYRNSAEMSATRAFSALSPSCFAEQTWWSRFIHRSRIMNSIVSRIWKGADEEATKLADFERENALPGFEGLKFERYGGEECEGLSGGYCTAGCSCDCKRGYPFLSPAQIREFGLPHPGIEDSEEEARIWDSLTENATREILTSFPKLRNPPDSMHTQGQKETTQAIPSTPTRLYKFLAPLNDLPDPSLVFLSHVHLSNAFRLAEAQALWTTAYFSSHLSLPGLREARCEVAYQNGFSKLRYPAHGEGGNYFHVDLVGYTDALVREVGLGSYRGGGVWRDWVSTCTARDYGGMREEFLGRFGKSVWSEKEIKEEEGVVG